MPWKSIVETRAVLNAAPDLEKLANLWALSRFLRGAVLSKAYIAHPSWKEMVVFSKAGEELLQKCINIDVFDRESIALAMFKLFFYHDILIDIKETDFSKLLERINSDFAKGTLIWPYRFGRMLYDRFNDTYPTDRIDQLEPDEVQRFLKDTPAGVYQLGEIISGPFGLVFSKEKRLITPTLELPLWHCSDTGCGALHTVDLIRSQIPSVLAYLRIGNTGIESLGQRSEWLLPLDEVLLKRRNPEDFKYYDLAALIGDAIVGVERRALTAAALSSERSAELREFLRKCRIKNLSSAETIAEQLDEAQQLQLLLILSNKELITLIDTCVFNRRIDIPLGELRASQLPPPRLSRRYKGSDLSSLGMRSKPRVPLASLHRIIWDSYDTSGQLDDLGWKLKGTPNAPPPNSLMELLRSQPPRKVIADLILSSMPITRCVAASLGLSIETISENPNAADLLLWKLGFHPAHFADDYNWFEARIENFSATVLNNNDLKNEEERERVRSSGVNLFVSVEHFLEELISYNTWLLSSDHFVDNNFTYLKTEALIAVPKALGHSIQTGGTTVSWSTRGDNTLGTLLAYAQRMMEWMTSLKGKDRQGIERPKEDLPHYTNDPEQIFPFSHTELWADTDPFELDRYIDGLMVIVDQLNRAEIASIRNSLDHKRESKAFPSADQLLACSMRLKRALDSADLKRYLPKVLWLRSILRDRFGIQNFAFTDSKEREVVIGGPPVVLGLDAPDFDEPFVVPAANLLGRANAELRFRVRSQSVYSSYWSNYPRRRPRLEPSRDLRNAHVTT